MGSFAQIFQQINQPYGQSKYHNDIPMLNVLSTSLSSYFSSIGQLAKKKALMAWYRRTPELTAFINKVAGDTVSSYSFEPIDPKDTSRNKIQKANKFAQSINLTQVMDEQFSDILITGDGFGWIGKLDKESIKKKMIDVLGKYSEFERKQFMDYIENIETKQNEGFSDYQFIDEDLFSIKKYRSIPSSTIEVIYDQYEIKGYKQIVGVNETYFGPKDIIHFTMMKRDGKVEGFTPVESVIVQLELLRQMWQNQLALHRNGGHPDKIIAFENIQPNNPSFERMKEELQKYKLVENRHGHMVFTGKVNVTELQDIDKMQFMDSGLYITGLIAMQWGIPRSSIPFIVGGANTKDDTGGNSEKGYWEVIRRFQETYAELYNTQLWIPYFGVRIRFDHPYYQIDVQMEQARQMKLNNIQLIDTLATKSKKKLTFDTLIRTINGDVKLSKESFEDFDPMEQILQQQGQVGTLDKQISKDKANDTEDKKNIKKKKQDEQVASNNSAGKPTGVGKMIPLDDEGMLEFKQMFGAEEEVIDIDTFVKIYNEDMAYHPGMPPRIFLRRNDMFTTMKFKSTDFVYKVIIPTEELDSRKITFLQLGSTIYEL